MAYNYADFSEKSARLLAAGEHLLESLHDRDIDRSVAIQDIEAASRTSPASDLVFAFSPAPAVADRPPPPPSSADDILSGVLFDLHAANVLLSSGIALNQHGKGADESFLNQTLEDIETSRSGAVATLSARATLAFAPKAGVNSSSLEAAKKAFQENSAGVLADLVEDGSSVVNAVVDKLKAMDGSKILEGIDKLGQSFPAIAAAGTLIRQGIEKLKQAFDALAKLFGNELFEGVRKKVAEIWKRVQSGELTKHALTWAFNVAETQAVINQALARTDAGPAAYDAASNQLPGVSEKSKSNFKLLRSLLAAIGLAAAILGLLHVAAPWLPLALIGLYAAVIAATVLIGMDYCDSGRVLNWARGVGQIASDIKATP